MRYSTLYWVIVFSAANVKKITNIHRQMIVALEKMCLHIVSAISEKKATSKTCM